MLVLSRKRGESLVVGGEIRITVTRISGNRVSIGIEAPAEVRVVRAELAEDSRSTRTPPPEPAVLVGDCVVS